MNLMYNVSVISTWCKSLKHRNSEGLEEVALGGCILNVNQLTHQDTGTFCKMLSQRQWKNILYIYIIHNCSVKSSQSLFIAHLKPWIQRRKEGKMGKRKKRKKKEIHCDKLCENIQSFAAQATYL